MNIRSTLPTRHLAEIAMNVRSTLPTRHLADVKAYAELVAWSQEPIHSTYQLLATKAHAVKDRAYEAARFTTAVYGTAIPLIIQPPDRP